MSVNNHLENRAWAFEALQHLKDFVEDADFEADREEERLLIERKRKELQDGRYRVVFVGAFNVGKSTLINAFLGDEYLPTVLEECTTKITHVVRGDEMKVVLRLIQPATLAEIDALNRLLEAYGAGATIKRSEIDNDLSIFFEDFTVRKVRQTLAALGTVSADEDFPQMRPLRDKFEEILVSVPDERLEEDIALVDSPGVHSISETHSRIAQDIIPHSHLVVCLLDSQNAGNEQNRDFIQDVVNQRRRQMFFLVNKSDQLNDEEIDPTGHRGPAKDLCRALEGIVAQPELFFMSSLYALLSGQLGRRLTLDDLDRDNKVKIPFEVQQRLRASEDPDAAAAEYLLERSRFPIFRERLLSYLYTENREGAIVESVCSFIERIAWRFARPLEVKLELARNVPRLEDLSEERRRLLPELDQETQRAERLAAHYATMTAGGDVDGAHYPGYVGVVDALLDRDSVQKLFLGPLRDWIQQGENYRNAVRNELKPLTMGLERRLEAYLGRLNGEINKQVDVVEQRILAHAGPAREATQAIVLDAIEATRYPFGGIPLGLKASYAAFTLAGAVIGAGLCAGAAWMLPDYPGAYETVRGWLTGPGEGNMVALVGMPLSRELLAGGGAIAGAAAGAVLGWLTRAVGSTGARKRQLARRVCERVDRILLKGYRDEKGKEIPSIHQQYVDQLEARKEAFGEGLRESCDAVIEGINQRLAAIDAETTEIRRKQAETIERLEPKVARIKDLAERSAEIARFYKTAHPAAPALRELPAEDSDAAAG